MNFNCRRVRQRSGNSDTMPQLPGPAVVSGAQLVGGESGGRFPPVRPCLCWREARDKKVKELATASLWWINLTVSKMCETVKKKQNKYIKCFPVVAVLMNLMAMSSDSKYMFTTRRSNALRRPHDVKPSRRDSCIRSTRWHLMRGKRLTLAGCPLKTPRKKLWS